MPDICGFNCRLSVAEPLFSVFSENRLQNQQEKMKLADSLSSKEISDMQGLDIWSVLMKVGLAIVILIVTWISPPSSNGRSANSSQDSRTSARRKQRSADRKIGRADRRLIIWLLDSSPFSSCSTRSGADSLQGLLDGIFGFLPNIIAQDSSSSSAMSSRRSPSSSSRPHSMLWT